MLLLYLLNRVRESGRVVAVAAAIAAIAAIDIGRKHITPAGMRTRLKNFDLILTRHKPRITALLLSFFQYQLRQAGVHRILAAVVCDGLVMARKQSHVARYGKRKAVIIEIGKDATFLLQAVAQVGLVLMRVISPGLFPTRTIDQYDHQFAGVEINHGGVAFAAVQGEEERECYNKGGIPHLGGNLRKKEENPSGLLLLV